MDIHQKIIDLVSSSKTELPALPAVVNNILSAASKDSTTTEDLAGIISLDQGITNKLLRLANSIYYGQRTKVATVKRAIVVIGFDEIIGIVMGMSVLSSFASKTSGMTLDMKALWIHCIGCATVAKEIATRTNPGIANKIFVPGLLHDMGKIIFSVYFKKEYRNVRALAMEKHKPLYRVEPEIFKMDHAILAGLLMKRWNFPDDILLPCRFHHNPEACPAGFRHHSLIINLADYLCQKANIGHSGNPVPVAVKNSPKKTGISANALIMIIDQLKKKEQEIKEFFEITTEI